MGNNFRPLLVIAGLALATQARAQDAALDDKLRDLLHQTTEQLRAAQDSQATLQAQLDAMTRQRDALQSQLADLQAKPAAPTVTPQQVAALKAAMAQAASARAALAQQQAGLDKWQKAYADAAAIARDRDAADRRDGAALKIARTQLGICKAENAKLIDIATGILHLYQTPQWNRLLIANHDHLLGFARVRLENEVQDYEDKIDAQSYVDPAGKP
jgi:hypothetical protein